MSEINKKLAKFGIKLTKKKAIPSFDTLVNVIELLIKEIEKRG